MNNDNYPRVKQVLHALIQDVDPDTGTELPRDAVLNRVDFVRALLSSVNAIGQVTARAARRAMLPDSVGQHWTPDEESRLRMEFLSGTPIAGITRYDIRLP